MRSAAAKPIAALAVDGDDPPPNVDSLRPALELRQQPSGVGERTGGRPILQAMRVHSRLEGLAVGVECFLRSVGAPERVPEQLDLDGEPQSIAVAPEDLDRLLPMADRLGPPIHGSERPGGV